MNFQSPAQILFPERAVAGGWFEAAKELPPRSLIGITEKYEIVGEVETDRNIHGGLITYRPAWMRQGDAEVYRITLAASGDDIHKGLLDDMPIGTRLLFRSSDWWVATLLSNQVGTPLKRKCVPGSVHVRNPRLLKSPDLPCTVDANRWGVWVPSDASRSYPLNVFYRPEFFVEVTARDRGETDRHGRNRSWGMTLEEVGPVSYMDY